MPHIDLTTSPQATTGLSANRSFSLQATDKNTVVAVEACKAIDSTTGVRIDTLSFNKPKIQITDSSVFLRYRVLSGTVVACWVDADAAAQQGPAGAPNCVTFEKAVDGSAAATTSLKRFYRAPGARTVAAVHYIPEAGLTANNSNFKSITVSQCSAVDGTVVATAASLTTEITGSGDWTAGVPVPLTLGAGISLTAGQTLGFAIAKTGTGVVIPAGTFVVTFA
jgi:hypothetical protein